MKLYQVTYSPQNNTIENHLGRHWIWSDQLKHNLVYKTKGREDALLASIDSLLFSLKLRDERIAALQRIANLATEFADKIKPDEETDWP